MANIEISGQIYELGNEPTHGVIKKIKRKKQAFLVELLKNGNNETMIKEVSEKVKDGNTDKEELVQGIEKELLSKVMNENPELLTKLTEFNEDFEDIATISIATNHIFDSEDLDDLTESEFQTILEKCKKSIGGSASDFLDNLEMNISSKKKTPKPKK